MKKLLSTNKGTLLIYGLIMGSITLLSLLFLIGGIYEVSAVLAISTVTTFVVLVIMLYGNLKKTDEGTFKAGSFIGLSILRFLFMILGIVLSAIMLYLTGVEGDKTRLFYSVLSLIPIVVCITLYVVRGRVEWLYF